MQLAWIGPVRLPSPLRWHCLHSPQFRPGKWLAQRGCARFTPCVGCGSGRIRCDRADRKKADAGSFTFPVSKICGRPAFTYRDLLLLCRAARSVAAPTDRYRRFDGTPCGHRNDFIVCADARGSIRGGVPGALDQRRHNLRGRAGDRRRRPFVAFECSSRCGRLVVCVAYDGNRARCQHAVGAHGRPLGECRTKGESWHGDRHFQHHTRRRRRGGASHHQRGSGGFYKHGTSLSRQRKRSGFARNSDVFSAFGPRRYQRCAC